MEYALDAAQTKHYIGISGGRRAPTSVLIPDELVREASAGVETPLTGRFGRDRGETDLAKALFDEVANLSAAGHSPIYAANTELMFGQIEFGDAAERDRAVARTRKLCAARARCPQSRIQSHRCLARYATPAAYMTVRR